MVRITVAVLTYNEADNISDCLSAARWADELLVLDSLSSDDTAEIARQHGAVVHQRPFRDYADQRNAALDLVDTGWVFFVDADERCTPELEAEIRDVTGHRPETGWWVPRRNYIFGKWIRHTGWYPDYQMRLLRKGCASYDPSRPVHEVVLLEGAAGHLTNLLEHHNYRTLGQFMRKQRGYTDYEAHILHDRGIRPRWRNFVLQPLREFRRRFVTLQGYRDGLHGLLLSLLMAYFSFVTYVRLTALWGGTKGEPEP